MTKTQLNDAIRFEARQLPSSTLMQSWIYDLIDEILLTYTTQYRYQELINFDQPLTLVAGQGFAALPTDYHHLWEVKYDMGGTGHFATLQKANQFTEKTGISGNPTTYFLSGGKLYFWPYSNITTSDVMQIDYYQVPTFGINDPFPIPSLEAAVKAQAVARVLRYAADMDGSAVSTKDATIAFSTSHNV